MSRLKNGFGLFDMLRDRLGTAAVEFALGAPVIMFSFIMMSDIGFAVAQKMVLDQAVRAGASFAMEGVEDELTLENLVISSATGRYSDTPTADEMSARPTVDVIKVCECPDGSPAATCSTLCLPEELPPSVFYQFSASRTYTAIMLPDIPLSANITVQIR